jgi:predicted nucleotidyltransferase
MRVSPDQIIAGQDARSLRALLRHFLDRDFSVQLVRDRLELGSSEARRLVERLVEEALIEPSEEGDGRWYRAADKGRSLALASFGQPLKRSTAERKIREFLHRVQIVNGDPYFLYAVSRVVLFGSMLGEADRVGDIDLVVDLESKIENLVQRRTEERARINGAILSGRRFSNIVDDISWPQREVFLFLKSRSRGLSFHDSDDSVLEKTPTKQLFP